MQAFMYKSLWLEPLGVLSSVPYQLWQSSHDGFGAVFEKCLYLKFPDT